MMSPEDINRYATEYLWNEVLLPENLLTILAGMSICRSRRKKTGTGANIARRR